MLPSGALRYSHVVADKIHWKPKQNLIEKAAQADVGDEEEEEGEMSFFSMLQPPAPITVPPRPGKHDDDDEDERESDLELTFEFGLTVKEVDVVHRDIAKFPSLTSFIVAAKCGGLLHGRCD